MTKGRRRWRIVAWTIAFGVTIGVFQLLLAVVPHSLVWVILSLAVAGVVGALVLTLIASIGSGRTDPGRR